MVTGFMNCLADCKVSILPLTDCGFVVPLFVYLSVSYHRRSFSWVVSTPEFLSSAGSQSDKWGECLCLLLGWFLSGVFHRSPAHSLTCSWRNKDPRSS